MARGNSEGNLKLHAGIAIELAKAFLICQNQLSYIFDKKFAKSHWKSWVPDLSSRAVRATRHRRSSVERPQQDDRSGRADRYIQVITLGPLAKMQVRATVSQALHLINPLFGDG